MRRILTMMIVLTAILGLVHGSSAAAQQQGNEERITLSPAVSRPELDAGQVVAGKLTIINDGQVGYEFLVYARPFSVSGEGYDPNYTEINERTEAYQWVSFDNTEYRLEPGESVEVGYTVRVPKDAASGGHYAVLFAETQPPAGSANVARKKRVGSLLYMNVSGDTRLSGSLESWGAPFWQKRRPVTSQLRIRNDGNTHFQADLQATYTNILGKKQFELNQQLLILPGTTRRVPVTWQNTPTLGLFKASGTVTFLDQTHNLPTQWVLLLPVRIVAVFVSVIVVLLIILWLKKRKNSKHKSARLEKRE